MADRGRFLTGLFYRAVDYLFPPLCIACDKPRSSDDRWLCDACKDALLENHCRRDPCPRCAMNRKRGHCACTRGWEQPFASAYSIVDFDTLVQTLLHQVKYRGKQKLAVHLGKTLGACLAGDFFERTDALVAVPLHKRQAKKRGYNQSCLFARGLHDACCPALPILSDALARVKDTPSQTKLDKEERLKNMRGAFAVPTGQACGIAGKRLLLVDDTITTGATVGAAAKALLGAGAASVRVLSIARD